MSKCYKCDRCGTAYTENNTPHVLIYGLLASRGTVTGIDIKAHDVKHHLDLCDECIDALWTDFLGLNPTDALTADK